MELTAKHGVTTWKRDKAWAGYTLFTPMMITRRQMEGATESKVYLLDMNGRIVHFWTIPGVVKLHAELMDNGHILCAVDDLTKPKTVTLAFSVHALLELDWDSQVVWRYENEMMDCHDRCRLRNGNTLIQRYQVIDPALQAKVQGGEAGTENKGITKNNSDDDFGWRLDDDTAGVMYTLVLEEISPEGNVVWEMNLSEALDPEVDRITPLCGRELWPGLNSIEEMPDGNIISTSYNLSTVFIWDRAEKKVKWRFGNMYNNPSKHRISFPHDPTVLDNGNIMVFDNGRFYAADPDASLNFFPPDFSRVLEINPKTDDIVWEYRAENPVDFYSSYISSARRLPNGNTLICEGATGRMFEVTQRNEIVWEYLSPFYSQSSNRYGTTNAVFRCMRYDADHPAFLANLFDDAKTAELNNRYGPEAQFHSINSKHR